MSDFIGKPRVPLTLDARELVLPYPELRASLNTPGGEHVDHMTRALLGWAKVDRIFRPVGEVMITILPSLWQNKSAEATKGVQESDVCEGASEKVERGSIPP